MYIQYYQSLHKVISKFIKKINKIKSRHQNTNAKLQKWI